MKKSLFILFAFFFYAGCSANSHDLLIDNSISQHPWIAFLAQLPEDSWLRKKCENEPCSYCNDIAVAVYLLSQNDPEKRKIGLDFFYNAQLVLFSHDESLRPEDVVEEIYQAERALKSINK